MASGVLASQKDSNLGQARGGGCTAKTLLSNPNPNSSTFSAPKRSQNLNRISPNGRGQFTGRCFDDSPIVKLSAAWSSDNASSLNHKPLNSNGNVLNLVGANGERVRFHVAMCSRKEATELKERLSDELERVQNIAALIESGEFGRDKVVLGSRKRPLPEEPKRAVPVRSNTCFNAALTRMCKQVLGKLMKQDDSWVFNAPVDVEKLRLHDYYQIVKNPMDLGTVKSNLFKGAYRSPGEFAADVRLTFDNAMLYNPRGNDVHQMAVELLAKFENWFRPVYRKLLEFRHHQMSDPITDDAIDSKVQVRGKLGLPQNKKFDRVHAASQRAMSVADVHSPIPQPSPVRQPPLKPSLAATKSGNDNVKPPKPKAMDSSKREMNMDEKQMLSMVLESLLPEKSEQVVQIISKRNELPVDDEGQISIEIGTLDVETLWELHRFVTNWKKTVSKVNRQALMDGDNVASIGADGDRLGVDNEPEVATIEKRPQKGEEEDVDIGDVIPVGSFPPVEIEKDDGPATNSSSTSTSSSSDSSSSNDSDSGSSSGSDSDGEDAVRARGP